VNLYLGIDPGATGGLALLNPFGKSIWFSAMPETNGQILSLLKRGGPISDLRRIFAVVEEIPTAIFGTDKSSMAKLYGSYTKLCMALDALVIPYRTVKAVDWHKGLNIPARLKIEDKTAWKNRLKQIASKTFPDLHVTLATADALLIAEYCRLTYTLE
jgi:hypothetical protein